MAIQTFDRYKYERETEPERFHEGGHGAIAREWDRRRNLEKERRTRFIARLTGPGSGTTDVAFPPGTEDHAKCCVSVAGCMAEARKVSGRDIDTDEEKLNVMAASIISYLEAGHKAFSVEVPVTGDMLQAAACNADDFAWLKGRKPRLAPLTKAAVETGTMLNSPDIWDKADAIAEWLIDHHEYDSADDE